MKSSRSTSACTRPKASSFATCWSRRACMQARVDDASRKVGAGRRAAMIGLDRARLDAHIAALGRAAGPPWAKDQKEAAAAALAALARAGGSALSMFQVRAADSWIIMETRSRRTEGEPWKSGSLRRGRSSSPTSAALRSCGAASPRASSRGRISRRTKACCRCAARILTSSPASPRSRSMRPSSFSWHGRRIDGCSRMGRSPSSSRALRSSR